MFSKLLQWFYKYSLAKDAREFRFESAAYAELPYPAHLQDAIQGILPIFSFATQSSGDSGTCLAEGHSTVDGILLNLFGTAVTIGGYKYHFVLCFTFIKKPKFKK